MKLRSDLENSSGFSSSTLYSVPQAIEAASQTNMLFRWWVKEPLKSLRCRFDLKYWPSLSDLIEQIASDARSATTEAQDPITAAATLSGRASLASFFRAFFSAIEENSEHFGTGFKLSDQAIAHIGNCALDLEPDSMIESTYVKRFRQTERESGLLTDL